MLIRPILGLILTAFMALQAVAQDTAAPSETAVEDPRAATGGATTLEDILRRQEGLKVDNSFRMTAPTGAPPSTAAPQLSPLGGLSDSDVWRDLRFNQADVTTQARGHAAGVLVQDAGMGWLMFREGPLATYGAWLLGGTLALLAVFFLLRGRIRIDGRKTGRTIVRFTSVERFGHWLFAGSFIVLGLTGLISLFGRAVMIPLFGKESFATLALASKWVHNNVAWSFMLGLVMIIVMWTLHNIPNRHDLKWLAVAGGLFSKGVHPPARKFNAGQKMIFWGCVVLGLSISASGLSLLFPFELPMFAKTFALLNDTGLPQWVGLGVLPTDLAPHQEMQLSQAWHAIVAFVFMAMILAHIYLGSIGMEGAFDAMGSGEVEEQWAREHHGLWVKEMEERARSAPGKASATPAE
ncbi:formate dehydrogenase subunit gamma [Meridianimarinicoccus roseus]|uniref:Formate dehydrogenase subunit gamma n=1 Tax=Meridianimarinicoccus roseus TaxID=2072018 RepID=A0A2V2LMV3_9RHOB|nr:formate dehydrogenase subunit gamma [Meridianimarinicoccus roseus]PWR04377.1 formate dehydrogenase subunit gamma [Meridianimarinicoccus roseus]